VCLASFAVVVLGLTTGAARCGAEAELSPKRWQGSAILGNGTVCAVYSDDVRSISNAGRRGIQHFYYKDFTADYVHSTFFELLDAEGRVCESDPARADSVTMENFHTTLTKAHLEGGTRVEIRAFAHPEDAIVLTYTVKGPPRDGSYRFWIRLPRRIVTNETIVLEDASKGRGRACFEWSDGTVLAVGTGSGKGRVQAEDLGVVIEGEVGRKPVTIIITAADSERRALRKLRAVRGDEDPFEAASEYWEDWLARGTVPDFPKKKYLDAYLRNLSAVKASCLGGQIPADLTGQFLTHNMPQLYPRDALMCARVLMLTGHLEEAGDVLAFWGDSDVPMKSPGEWYARYDAHGTAVDAGSGARYNEPEWDSNGYYIQLADSYREETGDWLCDPEFLLDLTDFLIEHVDDNGLLFEGGIVEWSGYLPATNMTVAAALMTMSRIALSLGDFEGDVGYRQASERISGALGQMVDRKRGTYADVRPAGSRGAGKGSRDKTGVVYLWDTSANFGVLWGYPDHGDLKQSNTFFAEHCVKLGGGMQYYDAKDEDLAGYGHDVFFFTTAAAAQYQARFGDPKRANLHIDWMMKNANVYGLMPERILLDGSDCSPASPLSWSCAEFVAALLEWARKQD